MLPARVLSLAFVLLAPVTAVACPFCVSEMQTLSEEIADAEAVVLARLAMPAANDSGEVPPVTDPETGEAEFLIDKTLKGEDLLPGNGRVRAIYYGKADAERRFFIRGLGQPVEWMIPLEVSPVAVEYINQLETLPESGAERLAFFQPYLEHEDRRLAQDAYDEFARAPYSDLRALKGEIDRERVLQMIHDPYVSPSRRRLFFVMLGVCGDSSDIPMLEAMLESDGDVLAPAAKAVANVSFVAGGPLTMMLSSDVVKSSERRRKAGLDAMIACYLTLRGEEGLDLIDRRFFANPDADQTHIYSALMALRFLADGSADDASTTPMEIVSRRRILVSARLLLNNRYFADQVITDLARWEDWQLMPRLADMFLAAGGEDGKVSKYVREPIVTFLDVASEQPGEVGEEALEWIAKLEPTDRETFRRARSLAAFGFLRRARPVNPSDDPPGVEPLDSIDDDPLPDPSSFDAADPEPPAMNDRQASTDEPQDEAALAQSPASPSPTPAATPPKFEVPAGADPLVPPSRAALVGFPLLALVGCVSLFWGILRGGV